MIIQTLRIAACVAVLTGAAAAQENVVSAPPPLPFPFEAARTTKLGLPLITVRYAVESTVDLLLCQVLMTEAGETIPKPFRSESCLPAYKQKVTANEGPVHWRSGARPLKCGASCLGRPFMAAEEFLLRPNLRRARLFGSIKLVLDGPGADRDLTYGYDAFFTCKAENGAKEGRLVIEMKFGQPVVGDPGLFESFISNVFTLGELSEYIDSEIKRNLPAINPVQQTQGRCKSVGVDRGDDPKFDIIRYDDPSAQPPPSASRTARAELLSGVSALRDKVKIEFLRIARNPLPPLLPPEFARPGDPFAAQFSVFINGAQFVFPAQGLALPPAGGSAQIHFCKTVDVTGFKTLQLLFVNDLGGGVWSQFPRSASFGAGAQKTMTTGRGVVAQGLPGPPDPTTGKPAPGGKPQPYMLREFELLYRITFLPAAAAATAAPPSRAGAAPSASPPPRAPRAEQATRGGVTGLAIGREQAAALPGAIESQPCIEL